MEVEIGNQGNETRSSTASRSSSLPQNLQNVAPDESPQNRSSVTKFEFIPLKNSSSFQVTVKNGDPYLISETITVPESGILTSYTKAKQTDGAAKKPFADEISTSFEGRKPKVKDTDESQNRAKDIDIQMSNLASIAALVTAVDRNPLLSVNLDVLSGIEENIERVWSNLAAINHQGDGEAPDLKTEEKIGHLEAAIAKLPEESYGAVHENKDSVIKRLTEIHHFTNATQKKSRVERLIGALQRFNFFGDLYRRFTGNIVQKPATPKLFLANNLKVFEEGIKDMVEAEAELFGEQRLETTFVNYFLGTLKDCAKTLGENPVKKEEALRLYKEDLDKIFTELHDDLSARTNELTVDPKIAEAAALLYTWSAFGRWDSSPGNGIHLEAKAQALEFIKSRLDGLKLTQADREDAIEHLEKTLRQQKHLLQTKGASKTVPFMLLDRINLGPKILATVIELAADLRSPDEAKTKTRNKYVESLSKQCKDFLTSKRFSRVELFRAAVREAFAAFLSSYAIGCALAPVTLVAWIPALAGLSIVLTGLLTGLALIGVFVVLYGLKQAYVAYQNWANRPVSFNVSI